MNLEWSDWDPAEESLGRRQLLALLAALRGDLANA